jgi:LacI family repressor for deo operon, udp, cdd, tsx, nupC, and nupG
VVHCDSYVYAGPRRRTVLSLPNTPRVIFCGSGRIAMGTMSTLEEAGVHIPKEISVMGIDDVSFAFLTRPPLTTISVPREQVGRVAFQALEKLLRLKRHKGAEYQLDTELIVRKSTAPAPQHYSVSKARGGYAVSKGKGGDIPRYLQWLLS